MTEEIILGFKFETGSDIALRFLDYVEDELNDVVVLGYDSDVVINVAEYNERLKIVIEIGDDSTHDQIRRVIPLAVQYRDMLIGWQGPSSSKELRLLHGLDEFHQRGVSYKRLADTVNRTLSSRLVEYVEFLDECERRQKEWKEIRGDYDLDSIDSEALWWVLKEYIVWDERSPPRCIRDFEEILSRAFRMKQDEIRLFKQTGMERIRRGIEPFDREYPIYGETMRNALRRWRNSARRKQMIGKGTK